MDKPLHVVMDFNPVLRNRHSGFWTYGQGLLSGLLERGDIERLTLMAWDKVIASARPDFRGLDNPKVRLLPLGIRPRRWERWWRLFSWPTVQRWAGPFDVYHCFHHLMAPTGGVPRVLTVHDLRQYRMPELYPGARNGPFERAVRMADRIITYSDATRRDLADILHVPREHVDMSPLAMTGGFAPPQPGQVERTREWLSQIAGRRVARYALAVGSPDKRKNIAGVIRAFAAAVAGGRLPSDVNLVLAGKQAADENIAAMIAAAGIADRVVVTGPLEQARLIDAIAAADVFVFLSLYEGFGLPLLEAMACGTPVISSDRSCMGEVVGDAGILVDPTDAQAVAEHIVRLCCDADLRQEYSCAGLARQREFTWARTAADTVACYRQAIAGS